MALIPYATASGGVIEAISVSGDGDIGEGPISLNITIAGVGDEFCISQLERNSFR